jgi:hypothetical protein
MLHLRILFACLALLALFAGISWPALAQGTEPQPTPSLRPGIGLQLDVGVGQGYDDNLIGTGRGGSFTQLNATFDFHQASEHNSWSLNFQPTVEQLYNIDNRFNESVSMIDSWQVSRRWTLDLNGNYLHTSDPFASSSSAAEVSGPVVVAPNSTFIGPGSPITVFGGSATLHYQVGSHSELTFGGEYFSNRENNPLLPNAENHAFQANYTKMVRRGQSIGFLYAVQSFDVTNPEQQVTTHSLLLSYGYAWKPGWQITLLAGPQYSLVNTSSLSATRSSATLAGVKQNLLGYSAEATLSIPIAKQNVFQLMASRRVTDGAGVSGTVIQNDGQLEFSLRFNKRLSAHVQGFYAEYEALSTPNVAQPNSWGSNDRAVFNFTPQSSLVISYNYSHYVPLFSLAPLAPFYSHNRVLIEYHYSFGTLPGRR